MLSFSKIGTVQNFSKSLYSKSLWEKRKQAGYYDKLSEADPEKASLQEQVDRMHSEKIDSETEQILNKLKQGEALSPAEKEKLRQISPDAYNQAEKIEAERRGYEEKLEQCKTKEEVQRLKMDKINASLTKIQSVEHNPYIPDSKKLEIAAFENMKINAISKATDEFVQSGRYAKLETEAEQNAAVHEKNEGEREIRSGEKTDTAQRGETAQEPEDRATGNAVSEAERAATEMPSETAHAERGAASKPETGAAKASKAGPDQRTRKVIASYQRSAGAELEKKSHTRRGKRADT